MSSDGEESGSSLSEDEIPVTVGALVNAARYGRLKYVKMLVEDGVDVNGREADSGWTPLNIACFTGHKDVAEFLIENGADVNCFEDKSSRPSASSSRMVPRLIPPIFYACEDGRCDIVALLLARGASLDFFDAFGMTPIHVACRRGRSELVNFLLSNGATIEAKTDTGCTPLMTAALHGHHDIVLNLLEKGAMVNYSNKSNRTALYMACAGGRSNIVETLLAHGADFQELVCSDDSLLYVACKEGHLEVLRTLLAHGGQVTGKDYGQWNLLHPACSNSHYEVVKELLDISAKVDSFDGEGLTPLHNVCLHWLCRSKFISHLGTTNKAQTLKVLLEYGIDPNVLDKEGLSLMEKIRSSQWGLASTDENMLAILLDYGAGSEVICRVTTCDCTKNKPVAMCIYYFYRSMWYDFCTRATDDDFKTAYEKTKGIIDTYEKYFIKTKLAGLPQFSNIAAPDPPLHGVDWDPEARESFRLTCEAELDRMKIDEINDTGATYFSLLNRDLPSLRHKCLLGRLTGEGCAKRYPIYGTMIYSSYVRLRRTFLEEECPRFFTLTSPPLPPECAHIVLCHLSERDLINVMDVFNNHLSSLKKLRHQRNSRKRKISNH